MKLLAPQYHQLTILGRTSWLPKFAAFSPAVPLMHYEPSRSTSLMSLPQQEAKWGPWTSSSNSTWELFRNANSLSSPGILNQKLKKHPSNLGFTKPSRGFGLMLRVENYWPVVSSGTSFSVLGALGHLLSPINSILLVFSVHQFSAGDL